MGKQTHDKKADQSQPFTWDDLKAEIDKQNAAEAVWEEKGGSPEHFPKFMEFVDWKDTQREYEHELKDALNNPRTTLERRAELLLKAPDTPNLSKISLEFYERERAGLSKLVEERQREFWNLFSDPSEMMKYMREEEDFVQKFSMWRQVYHRNVLVLQRDHLRREMQKILDRPGDPRMLQTTRRWIGRELQVPISRFNLRLLRWYSRFIGRF